VSLPGPAGRSEQGFPGPGPKNYSFEAFLYDKRCLSRGRPGVPNRDNRQDPTRCHTAGVHSSTCSSSVPCIVYAVTFAMPSGSSRVRYLNTCLHGQVLDISCTCIACAFFIARGASSSQCQQIGRMCSPRRPGVPPLCRKTPALPASAI
jgi:hypothetical protein